MTARDARGRFVTVPDLILDTACREAVARWQYALAHQRECRLCTVIPVTQADVIEVLGRATHVAELLGRAS